MNQELIKIFQIYSVDSHRKLHNYLLGKSKDALIGILVDLTTIYINDKNSSTVREVITTTLAGYKHGGKKIGYNGFKQDTFIPGEKIKCEAKPKNIDTNSEAKSKSKLNGSGNFSDYTYARLKRDIKEKNLNVVVSGFVDGRLIYIFEFPFNFKDFTNNLKRQVVRRFPKGKDISGEFLRSAIFDYRHFIKCRRLKTIFILSKKDLQNYQKHINKKFFDFIIKKTK